MKEPTIAERVISAASSAGTFKKLLPVQYRPRAARFLARAQFYLAANSKLHNCTVRSLSECVLRAAEMGLCLDGRMAHAVPFKNKKVGAEGKDVWVDEAVFMPDYKGLIDVGRRHGCFKDAYARHHYEQDKFRMWNEDGKWRLGYEPALRIERGAYLGTFAVLIFEDGRIIPDYMTDQEINSVRQRSKAKDAGPWVTDIGEMRKKTVLRRVMKTYMTDPEMLDLLDRDDAVIGIEVEADRDVETQVPMPRAIPKSAPEGSSEQKVSTNNDSGKEPAAIGTSGGEHTETKKESTSAYDALIQEIESGDATQLININATISKRIKGFTDQQVAMVARRLNERRREMGI